MAPFAPQNGSPTDYKSKPNCLSQKVSVLHESDPILHLKYLMYQSKFIHFPKRSIFPPGQTVPLLGQQSNSSTVFKGDPKVTGLIKTAYPWGSEII